MEPQSAHRRVPGDIVGRHAVDHAWHPRQSFEVLCGMAAGKQGHWITDVTNDTEGACRSLDTLGKAANISCV